jgi:ATP-dependent Clp protease ATP-binding subunit ClpB
MGAIVDIQLERLAKLLSERKITVTLSEEARTLLAEKGYDPAYGARPLKRVIQKSLQDPLAEEILSGRVVDGDDVDVGVTDGIFTFNGDVPIAKLKEEPRPATLH